jgi:glyoxylase-like metal-dependent hydrolase (beta-lactamase superfamily II)
LLPEEGVLCSGDHVMGWSTSVIAPPDGHLGDYLASLEKLLGRPQDRRYLPTHGPEITEPRALVRAFLAHRRERSDQILDALAAGPATIAELVPRLYADVSKRLWRGAASSMYAHLLHLEEAGMVEADDGSPLRRSSRIRRRS